MQVQRNLAKQELIYDLLFGSQERKTPLKGAQKRFGEARECIVCVRDKFEIAKASGFELNDYTGELLCIDCKRGLFSFEGFRYQCKQVKNRVSSLERLSVVLNEQMGRLHSLISKERVSEKSGAKSNQVPEWCNRDIPSKFGKGGHQVSEGIQAITRNLLREDESRLSDQLQLFHDDLLNLQETIFTFISVLEAYIDTPWISVLKDRSHPGIQPCVADTSEGGETLLRNKAANPDEKEQEQTNSHNTTTAQRIERIRRQQEKVRQQIKALYDNTTTKDPSAENSYANRLSFSFNSDESEHNPGGSTIDNPGNQIADYFLFEPDSPPSDGDTVKGPTAGGPEVGSRGTLILKNYDILWSPSSSSSSSSSPRSPPSGQEPL
ncbi:hypothetical protein HWI79_3185 [Cryptosporidium felis]|nr:hypothetical protein HWI79_3185 [Cryptosporidium felis]